MQFLKARDFGSKVIFDIWLDETKVQADGQTPDPQWVIELSYGLPPDITQTEHDTYIQKSAQEAKLFATNYMATVNAKKDGIPLAMEGSSF